MSKLHSLLDKDGELLESFISSESNDDGMIDDRTPGAVRLAAPEDWSPESGDGLVLEVDTEPVPEFIRAPIIAINFPVFNDGRGLSLAVLLRSRYGYKGDLRAVGDIHPELLYYMKRCGFDSYELQTSRSQMSISSQSAQAPYSDYYQASVVEPDPVYRRVRRGA